MPKPYAQAQSDPASITEPLSGPMPDFETTLLRNISGATARARRRGTLPLRAPCEVLVDTFGDEQQDRTCQAAVAWSGGELALSPRALLPGEAQPRGGGPVTEAFRVLGVTGRPGQDQWVSFGLYQFNHMQQWLEVPGLIKRLPRMELVWGQPDEDWAGFNFDTDYHTRAGDHPFRLRVGTRQVAPATPSRSGSEPCSSSTSCLAAGA